MKLLSYQWKMVFVVLIIVASSLLFVACGVESKINSNANEGTSNIDKTVEYIGLEFTNPVANITGKNIYMDITETGEYMLHINDQSYTYNWTGMTPRGILPRIALEDFDGDGQAELAVILYVGSGTGILISELHMLEINQVGDAQQIEMYTYQPEQYINQLQKMASIRLFEESSLLQGKLAFGENRYEIDLQDLQISEYGTINDSLIWGSMTEFSVEGQQLIGTFGVAVGAEKIVTPIYIGKLITVISYLNGEFSMNHLEFHEEVNK